jgi:hypothetical protein
VRRMKTKLLSSILLALLLLAVFPITALAATPGAVVLGNSYTLSSGQVLDDNLVIFGGNVDLMSGSTINGNVVLLGGSLQAAGTINGNLTVLGGTANLANSFILNGDLTTAGSGVNRQPGAQITGQINTNPSNWTVFLPGQVQVPYLENGLNPLLRIGGFFLRLFLWVLAAMLLAMFIPNQLNRTSHTALTQPLISGGLGLLTAIIVPIVMVLLAITICLIPVSLLGLLLLALAWIYGLISIGYVLGNRIVTISKIEWHPAFSAGLGTLLLIFILNGLDILIPCVGWLPKVLVGFVGLGAVLLTQFGMKEYNPTSSLPATTPGDSLPPTA